MNNTNKERPYSKWAQLEDFYNSNYLIKGLPPFKDLKEEEIKQIETSFGFAGFSFQQAVNNFRISLFNIFPQISK